MHKKSPDTSSTPSPAGGASVTPAGLEAIFANVEWLLRDDAEQNRLLPEPFRSDITNGLDCDELPDAEGDFGLSPQNPIPVNGPVGEVLYLSRLRARHTAQDAPQGTRPTGAEVGVPIMFHRVGSEAVSDRYIDVFEVLTLDRRVHQTLYLSMYHPRKSTKVPAGYNYAERLDPSNFLYGVNHFVTNFPAGLDAHIHELGLDLIGLPLPAARIRETLNGSRFAASVLDPLGPAR